MYLDGFGKFLSKNIFFFTLVRKNLGQKSLFWWFLKNTIFSQKIWLIKYIPREIPFLEMYNFIYFTLLVFKLWQKQFSQKAAILRGWHHP